MTIRLTFKLSEKLTVEPDLRSPSPSPQNPKCINIIVMNHTFILSEKLTVETDLTSPSPNPGHIRPKVKLIMSCLLRV